MIIEDFTSRDNWSGFDVCVVGSGPVGATLAHELRRHGLRVLILESGAMTEQAMTQELAAAEDFSTAAYDDLRKVNRRQLGGGANLWGGRCVPFDPIDFEDRFTDARWPFSYDELAKHFPRAAHYAECGPAVFEHLSPVAFSDEDAFSMRHIERYSLVPSRLGRLYDTLATDPDIVVQLNATVTDFNVAESGEITSLTLRAQDGRCFAIRPKLVVLAMGGLENARLLLNVQRTRPNMFGGSTGALGKYYMGHFYGRIAEIEFRNEAAENAFRFYRDEHGFYVRRRFTPRPATMKLQGGLNAAFWPVVPGIFDPAHGSATLSAAYLALRMKGLGPKLLPDIIRERHAQTGQRISAHIFNVMTRPHEIITQALPMAYHRYLAARKRPGLFITNPRHIYGLAYHGEQTPSAQSKVVLGRTQDHLGLNRLIPDLRFTVEDGNNLAATHLALGAWLKHSGLGELRIGADQATLPDRILAQTRQGNHQIGLTRMGTNGAQSVVDPDLRLHGLRNGFVVGASVFPTSGQANPTFTAMTLAVRLAAHLKLLAARKITIGM